MKRYFEYKWNDTVKKKILAFYEEEGADSFGRENGMRKTKLKIDRILNHIEFSPNDNICDVGCSDGSLLIYLHGKYKNAVGFDIADRVIKQNNESNPYCDIRYETYDGVRLPAWGGMIRCS